MIKLISFLLAVSLGVALSRVVPDPPESIKLQLTFKKPVQLTLHKINLDDVVDKNISVEDLAKSFPEVETDQKDENDEDEDLTLDDIAQKIREFKELLDDIEDEDEKESENDDEKNDDKDEKDDDDDVAISEKDILELLPERFHVKEVMDQLENVEFEESDDEFTREYAFYTDEEGQSFFLLYRRISEETQEDFYFGLYEDEAGIWAVKPTFERLQKENVFDSESIGGIEHDKILLVDEEE